MQISKSILTRVFSSEKLKGQLLTIVMTLVIFGAPFVIVVSTFFNVMPTPFSVSFRVCIFLISVFLIITSITRFKKTTLPAYMLLIFWAIYSVRLIYDIEVLGILLSNKPPVFIYSFAFGNGLIPTIAIILNTNHIKTKKLINAQFYLLFATAFLICLSIINKYGLSANILSARLDLALENDNERITVLNAITISFVGSALGIISLIQLLLKKSKGIPHFLSFVGLIVGIFTLLLGASRGPTLAFLATFFLLFYIVVKRNLLKRKNYINKIKVWVVILFFVTIVLPLAYFNLDTISETINIVSRLEMFFSETINDANDTRYILVTNAWDQFLSHPFLGYHYLEMTLRHYPHNVYVEVFMATGVVGALFYYTAVLYFGFNFLLVLKRKHFHLIEIYLICLLLLIGQLTSGNLFMSRLWPYFAFLIALPKSRWNE